MTNSKLEFFSKIQILEQYYRIVPQVNLGTIIEKESKGYRNELFKNIDFAIFSKDYKTLLLLIELNDSSHNYKKRKTRDINLNNICEVADIPLMIFSTYYKNDQEYIYNRIVSEINKNIQENKYK